MTNTPPANSDPPPPRRPSNPPSRPITNPLRPLSPPRPISTPPPTGEPESDEFVAACRAIYEQWHNGTITLEDALAKIAEKQTEAETAKHIGNMARAHLMQGLIRAERNQYGDALTHYEKAHDLYLQAGQRTQANGCKLNMALAYMNRGNYAHADQLFTTLHETSVRQNDAYMQLLVLDNRAQLCQRMEQYDRAKQMIAEGMPLTDVVEKERGVHAVTIRADLQAILARVLLDVRDMEAAYAAAQYAVREAEKTGWAAPKAVAYRIMGRVLAAIDAPPPDQKPADFYFEEAVRLFREMDMAGEVAQTYFDQAVTLVEQGENEKARALLRKAMVGFNRAGMADDAAKAAELHTRLV